MNPRMSRRNDTGFSLIEVLVALAVISIVFSVLLFSQVGNLQISARTRVSSDMKAEAQRVLERQTANVLASVTVAGVTRQQFDQYYWGCPNVSSNKPSSLTITITSSDCSGTSGNTTWSVAGKSGYAGEGLIEITVTTAGSGGSSYALGNLISCYDAYPTPTADTPTPCPQIPTASGAGR